MKTLLKSLALASFLMVGALAIGVLANPGRAIAQDQEQPAETEQTQQAEQAPTGTYDYVAQPGDSYTKIARKAVQTYGAINNVSLSQAQIVAAETFLTQAAGSPSLTVGQEVKVNIADIKTAVNQAKALDEAAIARWEKYVAGVDFNTDKVGQA